jgi:GDPmannose 4,6-dehydratase
MKKKTALITGICGQDGSYIADMLLEKDYNVVGVMRRNATGDLGNAKHLEGKIDIVEGDITDMSSMFRIIQLTRPHELYNMAAMSHVHTSFEQPLATLDIDTKGVVNVLECVKALGYSTRIVHASTSEMFGSSPPPQNLDTYLEPQSPYAIAKVASHHFIRLYRKSYKMFACAAVTFNHESERRGPNFVTRKISMGVAKCLQDPDFKLKLGNMDAKRDWGYAPDFVKGFWMTLQQENPGDYVFATNEMHSVKEFCEIAFSHVDLNWEDHVEVDRFFMRPAEVDELCGDFEKTKEAIGWEPQVKFEDLVKRMVDYDCELLGVKKGG